MEFLFRTKNGGIWFIVCIINKVKYRGNKSVFDVVSHLWNQVSSRCSTNVVGIIYPRL